MQLSWMATYGSKTLKPSLSFGTSSGAQMVSFENQNEFQSLLYLSSLRCTSYNHQMFGLGFLKDSWSNQLNYIGDILAPLINQIVLGNQTLYPLFLCWFETDSFLPMITHIPHLKQCQRVAHPVAPRPWCPSLYKKLSRAEQKKIRDRLERKGHKVVKRYIDKQGNKRV